MRIGATPTAPAIANPVLSAMIPAVAIVTGVIAFSHLAPPSPVSTTRRAGTVWSLVHEGTYVIADERTAVLVDYRRCQDQRAVVSSKPPLYPTVIAGAYWVIHHVSGLV